VLARSVRNPLIIGVGTGLVLVSGTALAETPTPSTSASGSESSSSSTPTVTPTPTPTPTTPPPPADPTLSLAFKHVPSSVQQGASSSMYVEVTPHIANKGKPPANVSLHVGSSKAKVVFENGGKHYLEITSLRYTKLVPITVTVPSNMSKGKVDVWGQAEADNAAQVNASPSLSITVKAKPKSSSSSSGSGSSSNTSGSSSGTPSGSNLPLTSSSSATSAPSGNPAVLPSIAPGQTPSTAPGPAVQNTGNSQSMRGTGDAADSLTFGKLASTQAAWLAALLVAFSLLLTQVRLGRAAVKDPRAKGTHRRTRRTNGAH
jgi:hypothetical protein